MVIKKGKLVNCAFGANVPDLIELIIKELDMERRTRDQNPETCGRIYYELHEMTSAERERFDAKEKLEEENERIEVESTRRRREEYLTFVTDEIMRHSDDLGCSILMPHVVSRELLKKLTDPADKCHLVAKDKKSIQIQSKDVEVIEFGCLNPMPKYLLDHILNRDVFIVCWKLNDNNAEIRNVEGTLKNS